MVLKNRSNEIRSNEIRSNEFRIRYELPVRYIDGENSRFVLTFAYNNMVVTY